jgi:UDP:flavonoid glycosyltransferase YjiC (YdhE family)
MLPTDIKKQRVLLSPLNWGMGHVSRCIGLIDILLRNDNTIFIACSADQQFIFQQYYTDVTFIDHDGYPFEFGGKGKFSLDLLKNVSALKKRQNEERTQVDNYVDFFEIDCIISDHRYGFRSPKIKSIFLTHQLNLPLKWYERWVQKIHVAYLRAFDEIWVLDTEDSKYAGKLSRNEAGLTVQYIGILSRFGRYALKENKTIDRLIVISGPTIYAKQFLEQQLESFKSDEGNTILIASKELLKASDLVNETISLSDDWLKCDDYFLSSKKLISRSGYSTLMDAICLEIPIEITATRGQAEQEYLDLFWNENSLCFSR